MKQSGVGESRTADRHKHKNVLRVGDDIAEAVEEYCASLQHDPGWQRVARDLLREALKERGCYPAGKKRGR